MKTIMEVWNEEKEDQLISMIQERPALYDITENQYTNQGFKAQLWREIEHELLIPEKELRKRWDSLRTQYRRYMKNGPSGSCGVPKTSRQQWIMTLLRFLEPHRKKKETTCNLTMMESSAAVESWSPSYVDSHEEPSFFRTEPKSSTPFSICEEESSAIKEEPLPCTFSQPGTSPPQLKRSRRSLDDSFQDESDSLHIIGKTVASREAHEDMVSTYCKSMEHRMRKLPPHLLPHFMHDVDNSIFKYQVMLSSGENPQNTAPSEIQPLQPTSTNGNL